MQEVNIFGLKIGFYIKFYIYAQILRSAWRPKYRLQTKKTRKPIVLGGFGGILRGFGKIVGDICGRFLEGTCKCFWKVIKGNITHKNLYIYIIYNPRICYFSRFFVRRRYQEQYSWKRHVFCLCIELEVLSFRFWQVIKGVDRFRLVCTRCLHGFIVYTVIGLTRFSYRLRLYVNRSCLKKEEGFYRF